jgi:hypothetical protein
MPPEVLVKFMPPGAPPDVVKALGMLYARAVMLSDQYDVCLLCLVETLDNVLAAAEEKGAVEHSNQPGITGTMTVQ